MKMSRIFKGFIIGAVSAFVISSVIIIIASNEVEQDYTSRFYKQALSNDLLIQLYMFPFNDNDTVTMQFEGLHDEIIHIVHTEPNPDYAYIGKYVYEYRFHFDHELTIEEIE